jgi:flagellar P-ring protein precursor FlgI
MGQILFRARRFPAPSIAALLLAAVATAMPGHAFAARNASAAETVRLKDLGKFKGWEENSLVGYGLVTGLAGTGDSATNAATRQALANAFAELSLTVPASQIQSRNAAVVMVTAQLPVFAKEGDTIDVTVTSAGDARSLLGGTLLMAPLRAANGRVYALAEGSLSVGGYRYDANGNVQQKNHPTVGSIPNGGKVELPVDAQILDATQHLTFLLTEPDYTTAARITAEINRALGPDAAEAADASGIRIRVDDGQRDHLVDFMARIETIAVEPDRRARVVVNERTGTVVSGGDVRISQVAISQGDLKISIATNYSASQPYGQVEPTSPVGGFGGGGFGSGGVRTAIIGNTTLEVTQPDGAGFVPPGDNTVADLVQALAKLKMDTRDIISILRAVKAAGALHGELVIQ